LSNLYSDEAKRVLHSYEWPADLVIEIVEYEDHMGFRLFRDNFESFDGVDKEFIAKQVGGAITAVRKLGCPMYLEVSRGHGPAVNQERIR